MTLDIPAERAEARLVRSHGLLASYGELTLLHATTGGRYPRAGELLDALRQAAGPPPAARDAPPSAAGSPRSAARELNRRLAALLSGAGPDEFPPLCAFGPTGAGLAAIVYGAAALTLTVNGHPVRLDGRDAVTLIDRIVAGPVESIHVDVAGFGTAVHAGWLCPPSAPGTGARDPVPAPSPLPAPSTPPSTPPASAPAEPGRAIGYYCTKRHFNDPSVPYCTMCGMSMNQTDRTPSWGTRPQLGVLLVDDGSVVPLARDQVIGQAPEADESTRDGRATAVRLEGARLAPVHARITLDGWTARIADAGSAGGTYLWQPGEPDWRRVPPDLPAELRPGAVVAVGGRRLRYRSYRGPLPPAAGEPPDVPR